MSSRKVKPSLQLEAIECWPSEHLNIEFAMPEGTTLMLALEHLVALDFKPLVQRLSERSLTDLVPGDIGVNGRRAVLGQVLLNFDRIEFYRPLEANAKLARFEKVARSRKLARQQKQAKASG